MTYFVYGLYDPGHDPWYIGCSKDITRRLKEHRYGKCSATRDRMTASTCIGVIEEVPSLREARVAELAWQRGASDLGWSIVLAATTYSPFAGPHTQSIRERIAATHTGKKRPRSQAAKANLADRARQLSKSNIGKRRTPEQRARMSRAAFARWEREHACA
jgi:predicted GIY-YIG superfamily endonuclease